MGKSNFKSEKGRNYEISGNSKQGYSAKDTQNGSESVWASDTKSGMEKVINEVESGNRQDAGNFGKD